MAFLTKWIPAAEAEIDFEYKGYMGGNLEEDARCWCTVVNKGNGVGWIWGKEENAVTGITFFERDFTYAEEEEYYKSNFDENDSNSVSTLFGLFSDMNSLGDAHHEMWNAWVGYDFYEMNSRLREEGIILIGICDHPPYGCHAFGEDSCAYVAEDLVTGERFWSHGSIKWVKTMREQMEDTFDRIMERWD